MPLAQGTTFVLQKETVPRQKLLATISQDKGVAEVMCNAFNKNI